MYTFSFILLLGEVASLSCRYISCTWYHKCPTTFCNRASVSRFVQ